MRAPCYDGIPVRIASVVRGDRKLCSVGQFGRTICNEEQNRGTYEEMTEDD